ncbi:hypothetical protein P355_1458 [Burkholderia cenocepacia KC-01]|nr:hypothetical protein P355_1458 [Burkholderia cenocepacia KC-01]
MTHGRRAAAHPVPSVCEDGRSPRHPGTPWTACKRCRSTYRSSNAATSRRPPTRCSCIGRPSRKPCSSSNRSPASGC